VEVKNTAELGMEEEVAIVFRIILMVSTADLRVACQRGFPVMLKSRNMAETFGPKKGFRILTIRPGVQGVSRNLDPNGEEVTQRLDGITPCILADDPRENKPILKFARFWGDEKNISRWRKYLAMHMRWSLACQFH
jgi:hypothetical protein